MSGTYRQYRAGLYRSRHGILFGVCKGFADRFDLNVLWLRVAVVIALWITDFWPAAAVYLLAALLMKPAPRWR